MLQEKVRLRYKLTFNLGDKAHEESGDVDQFPPPTTWGETLMGATPSDPKLPSD